MSFNAIIIGAVVIVILTIITALDYYKIYKEK